MLPCYTPFFAFGFRYCLLDFQRFQFHYYACWLSCLRWLPDMPAIWSDAYFAWRGEAAFSLAAEAFAALISPAMAMFSPPAGAIAELAAAALPPASMALLLLSLLKRVSEVAICCCYAMSFLFRISSFFFLSSIRFSSSLLHFDVSSSLIDFLQFSIFSFTAAAFLLRLIMITELV